jgi:hypothetical protein
MHVIAKKPLPTMAAGVGKQTCAVLAQWRETYLKEFENTVGDYGDYIPSYRK